MVFDTTDSFAQVLKKHEKNKELLSELDKKIKRLQENPENVGGYLAGNLHGYKSTRLVKNFRLIFSINEENKAVHLEALDHRKDIY